MPQKRSNRAPAEAIDTEALLLAGVPTEGFKNLPIGSYEGYIQAGSGKIEPKPQAGHRGVFLLVAPEGPQFANYDLTTQVGMNIFLGALKILEVLPTPQPETLRGLSEALEPTDNLCVKFKVKPGNDEYVNVDILELLEGQGDSVASAEPVASDDEYYTKENIEALSGDEQVALALENGLTQAKIDSLSWEELPVALITLLVG